MPKPRFNQQTLRTVLRGCAATVMLALTLLLTAGPVVHGLIHKDAAAADHDCAFVHWANGEVGFAQTTVWLPPAKVTSTEQILPAFALFVPSVPAFIHHSRGPPQV